MKDLRKILKNCPSGMELDCTLCENVFFDKVIEDAIYPIVLYHDNNGCRNTLCLTEDGKFNFRPGYKCVIFPKGKTSWDDFVPPCKFKDGDIIIDMHNNICIYKGEGILGTNDYYVGYRKLDNAIVKKTGCYHFGDTCDFRLANENEKKIFFSALEEKCYRWNTETKKLDWITLFDIGNIIRLKDCPEHCFKIIDIKNDTYYMSNNDTVTSIPFSRQYEWELKPKFENGDVVVSGIGNLVLFSHTKRMYDKDIIYFHCILTPLGKLEIGENCGVGGTEDCTLASDKQRERLFNALTKSGYKWNSKDKTLEKLKESKFKTEDNENEPEISEEYLKLSLELFKKLPSQQIEPVKLEDIPGKIAELLSKALKKKVEIQGDGIKTNITVKF
jgi:hypothetical protein